LTYIISASFLAGIDNILNSYKESSARCRDTQKKKNKKARSPADNFDKITDYQNWNEI
jgi:hypothetical protein